MESILATEHLSKHYGKLSAVKNLSFNVRKGTVFGMLGPNGSGKTTTLGMLLGVTHPSSGTFSWFGKPLAKESLLRIGAILETPNFYPYLSAENNLRVVVEIKKAPHTSSEEVLKMVHLYERRKDPFKSFSLGMKQRLAIASALINKPEILILDEPTNGLDPQGIADVRQLIGKIAADGTTIILASHLLDEVEKICSDVLVLRKGESLYCGKVSDLLTGEESFELASDNLIMLEDAMKEFPDLKSCYKDGDKIIFNSSKKSDGRAINQYLFTKGITLSHLQLKKKSLEKNFLDLIKKNNA